MKWRDMQFATGAAARRRGSGQQGLRGSAGEVAGERLRRAWPAAGFVNASSVGYLQGIR
jgi:hypothetical protein